VTTTRPNDVQGSSIQVLRKAALPRTDLGWVEMTDHFLVTVGPHTGEGTKLGDLMVLADAVLAPKAQFALHAHKQMEIASIVLSGELTHREPDRALAVPAGSVQWMSAGDGIVHAETNPGDVPARLLQIWIRPEHTGGTPRLSAAGPSPDRSP
jgi:redox-sensitive bicupin YhaK (pirin superfamily)